ICFVLIPEVTLYASGMPNRTPSIHIANSNQKTKPPFVIPTGAKRSGGICSLTLGRNEGRKCNEPLPIRTSSLGPTDIYRSSFHPYRKCKSKDPTFPLSSRPERRDLQFHSRTQRKS